MYFWVNFIYTYIHSVFEWRNKMNRKIAFFLILGVAFFSVIFGIITVKNIGTKILDSEKVIVIKSSSGAKAIAGALKSGGVIKNKFFFINYVKKQDVATKLKPGTYKFGPGKVTFDDILKKLLEGEQEEHITVTIPEGYTVAQIAKLFADKGIVTKENFLEYASSLDIPYDYIPKGSDYRQLEGYLFPDTYQIPVSWNEEKIIDLLLSEFDGHWSDEYDKRAKELGFSVNEIVTIASLIEREAKIDKERTLISSVIHNRLKKGMLLQIDATVQYLLPEQKGRLLYKDLEVDSPYNTYKYAGLPPTAIAAPGISCIEAALYPDDTEYYYYRAKTSGNGEHYFSKTFEEHVSYAGK